MFKHDLTSPYYRKTYFSCFLLSVLAGSVNAGGFMASGRFVTHVTGFSTLFGIDLVKGNWLAAFGTLSVPLYFLLGAMISAYFVDRRIHQGQKPAYTLVMTLVSLCLLLVAVGGQLEYFGLFGKEANIKQDYLLLILLCGASGLQNAAITTFSGASVRTTHLTGITTDLGIGIVRIFSPKISEKRHVREVRANWLRMITIMSFILGSIIGSFSFLKLHYLGFLIPAGIAAYAASVSTQKESKADEQKSSGLNLVSEAVEYLSID